MAKKIYLLLQCALVAVTLLGVTNAALAGEGSSSHDYLRTEKFIAKVGGGDPFTWNASIECVLDKSGFRGGILAQGPHDPYNPEVVNRKPSITTYGVFLGWGYAKWLSKWKGSGAYGYLGSGTTKEYEVKFHYNYGYVANLERTILQQKRFALAAFLQYKKMFRVINKEDPGVTWETHEASLDFINIGLSGKF
jgi:hypothetical protein